MVVREVMLNMRSMRSSRVVFHLNVKVKAETLRRRQGGAHKQEGGN